MIIKKINFYQPILIVAVCMLFLSVPAYVLASPPPATPPAAAPTTPAPAPAPSGARAIPAVELANPLGEGNVNVPVIIGTALNTVMGILGAITLFVFIDGAWNWITSAGFPQRVQQGIRTMLFAVAGLFVIFAAYGILTAFINALTLG